MEDNTFQFENLPQDVIVNILSLLSLRETVATSAVSQKWKNLWKCWCSRNLKLTFDVDNIIGLDNHVHTDPDEFCCRGDITHYRRNLTLRRGFYCGMSSQIIDDFIKSVDMIVQCHKGKGQGVKSLEIKFPLQVKHSCHVDNWIFSTITLFTKELILILGRNSDLPNPHMDLYRFPFEELLDRIKLTLEHLQLGFISMKLPENFDGFTTLKTVKLKFTDVTQEDVCTLLISCPLLESLNVEYCFKLVALQVSAPLPNLKSLVVRHCQNLKRIELFANNLLEFELHGDVVNDHLMLSGCHNLTKAALIDNTDRSSSYTRSELSNDFPYVSALYLRIPLNVLNVVLRGSTFAHLKFLALFQPVEEGEQKDFQNLSSLVNVAAPMLEDLELHIFSYMRNCKKKLRKIHGGPFNHLKRIAFTGFTGETYQLKLVKYFLRNAPTLEVMTIDPLNRAYENFDAVMSKLKTTESKIRSCKKAYHLLCQEVPENVKLILI